MQALIGLKKLSSHLFTSMPPLRKTARARKALPKPARKPKIDFQKMKQETFKEVLQALGHLGCNGDYSVPRGKEHHALKSMMVNGNVRQAYGEMLPSITEELQDYVTAICQGRKLSAGQVYRIRELAQKINSKGRGNSWL